MKNKITQQQIAEWLGIKDTTISMILSNQRSMSKGTAFAIRDKTKLSYDYILETKFESVLRTVRAIMEDDMKGAGK